MNRYVRTVQFLLNGLQADKKFYAPPYPHTLRDTYTPGLRMGAIDEKLLMLSFATPYFLFNFYVDRKA